MEDRHVNKPNNLAGDWLPLTEAARHTPYSAEYLSLLARKKKLPSKKVNNIWYTTRPALEEYMKKQMLRTQLENGDLASLEKVHTYGGDLKKLGIENDRKDVPSPALGHRGEVATDGTSFRSTSLRDVFSTRHFSKQHLKAIFGHKILLTALVACVLSLVILPIPIVFSFFDKAFTTLKDAVNDSNTVMGFRPGTHENEILLLDPEGDIAIVGHIETGGQLRSHVAQGVAPIVVDSTTLVTNLNAEMVGGARAQEFTLAYVTKNGNMTTENVILDGEVAVGKTLRVKGAANLLSSLSVGGQFKSFGDAEFAQALKVLGPAYFDSIVTAKADLKVGGNISVDKNINVRGSVEAGSAIIGKSGSFGSLSASGSFSAGGKITLGSPSENIVITSKNFSLSSAGALSASSVSASQISAGTSTVTTLCLSDDCKSEWISEGDINDFIHASTTIPKTYTENIFTALQTFTDLVADSVSTDALTAEDAIITRSTTTAATSTSLFSTTARFTNLLADVLDLTDLIFTRATGTAATTTNFYSETASSTNLFSTSGNIGALNFGSATGAAATTTNFYSTTASSTNLFATSGNIGTLTAGPITSGLINGQTISSAASFTGTLAAADTITTSIGFRAPAGSAAVPSYSFSTDSDTGFRSGGSGFAWFVSNGADRWFISSSYLGHASVGGALLGTNTQAAPALTFGGDQNTGFYSPTTDAVGITTGGTEKVRIDSSGNVGIGTDTPTEKLYVSGNAIISGNSTTTSATTTNFYSTNGTFANLFSDALNITDLIFEKATGTAATTTNFYTNLLTTGSDVVVGGALTVNGSMTSSVTSGQIQFLATPQGTGISQGGVYINPASAGTNNVLLGLAVNGTEKARIDAEGDIQITGLFNSTNTSGTNDLSGSLAIDEDTTLGDATDDVITFNARAGSSILPSIDNTYDLGSESLRWNDFYATTAHFDSISTASSTEEDFIINSDNATADTEDSSLQFERGSESPNAILKWDSTNDRFDFNDFAVRLQNKLIVSGTASSTFAGPLWVTGTPQGTTLQDASLYINPSSASADYSLFSLGVNGVERLRVDAEGDTTVQASLGIENELYDITQDTLTISDDLKISGGDIKDSADTTRISIGSTNTVTGNLSVSTGALTVDKVINSTTLGEGLVTRLQGANASNARTELGFTYSGASGTYTPVLVGYQSTSHTGSTKGNFYIATRDATTDTAPTARLVVAPDGKVGIGSTVPTTAELSVTGGGYFTTGIGVADTNITSGVANVATGFRIGNAASANAVLRGNGTNFVSSAAAALTKTDDTNVTLTLGGTPTTALLDAVSLTLGWSGQLSVPRGGTGAATLTSNGVLYGNGTSAIQATAQGGANTILTANDGAPSFSASPTIGTSLTTPLVIGGTAVGSSLSLRSTSGVGTTDHIKFQVGNNGATEAMRIINSGYVGIGETTPISKFVVNKATSTTNVGEAVIARLQGAGAANARTELGLTYDGASGNYTPVVIGYQSTTHTGSTKGNFYIATRDATTDTAPTERLTILPDGNVGIGTSAPSSRLDLWDGDLTTYGRLFVRENDNGNDAVVVTRDADEGFLDIYSAGSITAEIRGNGVSYFNGGNVGIGDTSPDTKLEIIDTTTQLRLTHTDATDDTTFSVDTNGDMTINLNATTGAGNLLLSDADTIALGGVAAGLAYHAISDSGGATSHSLASDDDLFVEGDIEVNGTLFTDGALTTAGNLTIGDASGDTVTVNSASWTFANDTNFALSGGVNGLSFDTSTLSIDATNDRVGIGTTGPSEILHIQRDQDADTTALIRNDNSGSSARAQAQVTSDRGSAYFGIDSSGSSTFGGAYLYAGTSIPLSFWTNNAERVRIDSSGNVGIGDTSPDSTLEIIKSGTTKLLTLSSTADGDGDYLTVNTIGEVGIGDTAPDFNLEVVDDFAVSATAGGDGNLFVVKNTGNVGIGTSTPDQQFHFYSTVNASQERFIVEGRRDGLYEAMTIRSRDGGSPTTALPQDQGGGLYFRGFDGTDFEQLAAIFATPDGQTIANGDSPGALRFYTTPDASGSPTEKMRITQAGNVGIGETAPDARLEVGLAGNTGVYFKGGGTGSSADARRLELSANTTTNVGDTHTFDAISATGAIAFSTTGSETMRITGGNVGIGTTNPAANFHVSDSGTNTGWGGSSNIASTLRSQASGRSVSQQFSDGVNTAMYLGYLNGASAPRLGLGGTSEVLSVLNSGNVGIGSTTPSELLVVEGASGLSGATPVTTVLKSTNDGTWTANSQFARLDFHTSDTSNGAGVRARISAVMIDTAGSDAGLAFYTTGSGSGGIAERMRIDDAGLVGIGTASPAHDLHIADEANDSVIRLISHSDTAAHRGLLQLGRTRGTEASSSANQADDELGEIAVLGWDTGLSTSGWIRFQADAAWGTSGDSTDNPTRITFGTAPDGSSTVAEHMRITSAGLVGIGNTAPGLKLSVQHADTTVYSGTANAGDGIQIKNVNNSGTSGTFSRLLMQSSSNDSSNNAVGVINLIQPTNASHDSNFAFQLRNSSGNYLEIMRMLASGNVGIGSTAPADKLEVDFDSGTSLTGTSVRSGIFLDPSSTDDDFVGITAGSSGAADGSTQAGILFQGSSSYGTKLHFLTTDSYAAGAKQRMIIDHSGNVGIATTDPVSRLEIEDGGTSASMLLKITADDENPYGLIIGNDTFSTTDTHGLRFYTENDGTGFIEARGSGSEDLIFQANGGNVGIGTTGPGNKLHVVENAEAYAALIHNDGGDQNRDVLKLQGGTDANIGNTIFLAIADGDGTEHAWIQGAVNGADGGLAINTSAQDAGNFVIDESGNVGIGTTSPTQKLTISGSGQSLRLIGANDTGAVYSQIMTSGSTGLGYVGVEGSSAGATFTGTLAYATFLSSGASGTALQLGTAGAAKMTIEPGGNVGIGTTTPQDLLHLYSTTSAKPVFRIENSNGDAEGSELRFMKTTATPAANDVMGVLAGLSSDTAGTSRYGSKIKFLTESVGAGNVNGALGFYTMTSNTETERMRILNNGNVGIGTTTPSSELHVYGSSEAGAFVGSSNAGGALLCLDGDSNGDCSGGDYSFIRHATDGDLDVVNLKAANITFATNGTAERMVIDSSGNVGIGTTTPSTKLEIDTGSNTSGLRLLGAAEKTEIADIFVGTGGELILSTKGGADGSQYLDLRGEDNDYGIILRESSGATESSWANIYMNDATTDYLHLVVNSTNTANTGLVIDDNNNIGIGDTTPSGKLDIFTSSSKYVRVHESGSLGDLQVVTDNDSQTAFAVKGTGTADLVNIFDNATEVFTILDGGNVGIGTTAVTTGYKLDVRGAEYITSSTQTANAALMRVDQTSAPSGTIYATYSTAEGAATTNVAGYFSAVNATNNYGLLVANGNVGIGTTAPAANLQVVGSTQDQIRYGTNLTAYTDAWTGTSFSVLDVVGTTDTLEIRNDGTAQLKIDSAGDVGIGTTDPESKLHIQDGVAGATTLLRMKNGTAVADRPIRQDFHFLDSATTDQIFARIEANNTLTTAGSEDGELIFYTTLNGTLTESLRLNDGGSIVAAGAITEAGSAVISAANIDTCAEFIALVAAFDTGTCGNLVFSASPTLTGTLTAAAGTFSSTLTANSTLDANGVVTLGDNGDNITIDSNVWDITSAGAVSGITTLSMSGNLTLSGSSANILLGSNWLSGDGGDEGIFVSSTGNVGVGTSTPAERLDISGGGIASITADLDTLNSELIIRRSGTARKADLSFQNGETVNWSLGSTDSDEAGDGSEFFIGATKGGTSAAFWIESGGNVGVGTTTPWATLSVNAPAGQPSFAVGSSTATHLVVDKTGNVGIGTSAPDAKLVVKETINGVVDTFKVNNFNNQNVLNVVSDGSVYLPLLGAVNGDYICVDTSDSNKIGISAVCDTSLRSTKHDIQDLDIDALAMVDAIDTVSFRYNKATSTVRWGFIADDVVNIDPHLGAYQKSNGELISVDDRALIALSITALKELNAKYEAHATTTLAELAMINDRLENDVLTYSVLETDLASTTSTTTPISDESNRFVELVRGALGRLGLAVENGVLAMREFVTDKITSKLAIFDSVEVDALSVGESLCVDDVCVTKDELKTLLQNSQQTTNNQQSSGGGLTDTTDTDSAPAESEEVTESPAESSSEDSAGQAEPETPDEEPAPVEEVPPTEEVPAEEEPVEEPASEPDPAPVE